MAVTVDASLGQGNATGAATFNFNTAATVAAGAHIILVCGAFRSGAQTFTVSGGSLTWTEDKTVVNGSVRFSVFRAPAPSGLASGTTLTVSLGSGSNDMIAGAVSYAGIDTSGTVVTSASSTGSGTAWSSTSAAAASGNALIGGAFEDGTVTSSTPTSPAVEEFEKQVAGQSETLTLIDKLSVAGTDSLAGTWGASVTWAAAAVAYKPTAGGGGGGSTQQTITLTGVGS